MQQDNTKSIVIVDDSPIIMAVIRKSIAGADANIFMACSFEAAVAHCAVHRVDVMITDYNLDKGYTADQLIRSCNSNPLNDTTRYFLMTSDLPSNFRELRKELNIRGCLIKPILPKLFGQFIARLTATADNSA